MTDDSTQEGGRLLLVLQVPGDFTEENRQDHEFVDAIAHSFVDMINQRLAERGEMDGVEYEPVLIHAIPGPQLLSSQGLVNLVHAVGAIQEGARVLSRDDLQELVDLGEAASNSIAEARAELDKVGGLNRIGNSGLLRHEGPED